MTETPDIQYGRLLEAAEISGYAAHRAFEVTRGLLETGDWQKVGPGFSDVSEFVRSVPFGALNPPEDLRKSYERLASNHGASTRAIGQSVGVSHTAVQNDLRGGKKLPSKVEHEPSEQQPSHDTGNQLPVEDEQQEENISAKPEPVMLTLRTHTGEEVAYPKPQGKATFNQTPGEGISWASWSWNPVTGCLHGCTYCYAREIATSERAKATYPVGFTPLFHEQRLDAPANTIIPAAYRDEGHSGCRDGQCKICAFRRVFVCSMADLYGRWVPDEWIKQVHESMLASPQWEYLLLTKFPARYVGLDLPANAWVGTSIDEQKRVRIAEKAFRQIDGVKVKWLSLEPLLEPLEFSDLSMFDWVVIGAQTETRQPDGIVPAFQPPWEWVIDLTKQAKDAGCMVHWKPNLHHGPGMVWPNQYPGGA